MFVIKAGAKWCPGLQTLLKSCCSQNWIFNVGCQKFSKTIQRITMKFYTGIWDTIRAGLEAEFFFLSRLLKKSNAEQILPKTQLSLFAFVRILVVLTKRTYFSLRRGHEKWRHYMAGFWIFSFEYFKNSLSNINLYDNKKFASNILFFI